MGNQNNSSAEFAAEIIGYLSRVADREGSVGGLTSAQWTALRYFGRANSPSRTISAFADYHATTRGTASHTVKSLIIKELLTRRPSKLDGRSVLVDVSKKGRSLLASDPFDSLIGAIASLPEDQQSGLTKVLENVLSKMAVERKIRIMGACATCRHLDECSDSEQCGLSYFCLRTGEPLSSPDLEDLCMDYERRVSNGAAQLSK